MDFLLSENENNLCVSCNNLVHRFHEAGQIEDEGERRKWRYTGDHHRDGKLFFCAARDGCRICDILLKYHLRTQGSLDNDFKTEAIITSIRTFHAIGVQGMLILTIGHKKKIWMPGSSLAQLRATIYTEGHQFYNRLKDTCRSSPLSKSMDDPAVMEMPNQWFKNCITKSPGHKHCITPNENFFRPKRLLDVSGDTVHLSPINQRTGVESYCAFSYCWGPSGQPLLSVTDEVDFLDNVDFDSLPNTIKDAISVTRCLGIKYIWIDCLCIIQSGDNRTDWLLHSTLTSEIYSNCILNLSADRASTAQEGFLNQREWPALRPVFVDCLLHPSNLQAKFVITFANVTDVALATEPLGSRAWVLSERILSPRTLHFGAGEMFWECSRNGIASESCPCGFHTALDNHEYANFEFSTGPVDRVNKARDVEDWGRYPDQLH
jgi:hypothetical protein